LNCSGGWKQNAGESLERIILRKGQALGRQLGQWACEAVTPLNEEILSNEKATCAVSAKLGLGLVNENGQVTQVKVRFSKDSTYVGFEGVNMDVNEYQ
jgi:hypothetical protein